MTNGNGDDPTDLYAALVGDPFWLSLSQIGELTDRQISELYFHARRTGGHGGGGNAPAPGSGPDVWDRYPDREHRSLDGPLDLPTSAAPVNPDGPTVDGQPVSEEAFLWSLVGSGMMRRADVERVIAEKNAFEKAQREGGA